ncbi:MAG: aminotransferase class III-fold pyridoxal phosphate-dependent enzyme [Rhodospirillales bacterium]|jgi:taurine--2-oxoglutarate transaminase|nr:aminotransferase class III-fold pyridoxal phosphate-dependent enzyme [Rhodospirillales bacterium]MDP6805982.1 aminotransferase class III-fold pyridoxal phosphate-dependent enzyme [Rhodospirillales bacterium]
MSTNDISAENQKHVLFPWSKQGGLNSIPVTRAEGVYFWDADGKRYIDFASQLVCVNAGHQHPKIVKAIQDQAERLCYAAPSFATDVRGKLARMIAEVTPGDLCKTYFTSSGAEAVDYAVKIAKMASGRPKIIARHRSYHGAMTGPISLTGEWRRAYNEPGMVGVVHAYPPYCYRCSFGQEPESCKRECLSSLEEMIEFENPDFIAAIIVETITGPTAGLYVPPDDYMPKLRAICDKYGILLIADEVMSGWGRTGKWFAMDHWDVVPDILTTAKGLTNSMVPLGAVVVSKKIADYMDDNTLWSGSTYSGHALACAAGIASIEVYREDGLIENAAKLGKVLAQALEGLKEKHPSVGEVRGKGLFSMIELVKNRTTRERLMEAREGPYVTGGSMAEIQKVISDGGIYAFIRPNMIAVAPPLCITEEQLLEGLDVIDRALDVADGMLEPGDRVAAAE